MDIPIINTVKRRREHKGESKPCSDRQIEYIHARPVSSTFCYAYSDDFLRKKKNSIYQIIDNGMCNHNELIYDSIIS